jgi:hypothetical protein
MFSKAARTPSLQFANGEGICAPNKQNKTLIFKYNIIRNLINLSQKIFTKDEACQESKDTSRVDR